MQDRQHVVRILTALCALGALLTGCGSTVAPAEQLGAVSAGDGSATLGDVGDGLGAPTGPTRVEGDSGPGGVPSGGAVPAADQAAAPSGGAAPQEGQSVSAANGAPAAAAPRKGQPIQVGFYVAKDIGEAAAALGAKGLSTGNGRRHAEATASLLNRRGGVGGSKVVPVIFEYDVSQNGETQQQAACSLFFEDNRVAAVVSILIVPSLMTCAERRGVPFVTNGDRSTGERQLNSFAHAALPATMTLDRATRALVPSLQEQGWFKPASAAEPVKVGLLYNEDPEFAQVPADVTAQLRRIGLNLTDQQPMPTTDDTSTVTRASNAGSSAALRFRSKGITHVLSFSKSGQALAYFGLAAQNQDYYPRYGLTSLEAPTLLRTVLSKRQLEGARGIGWLPVYDVPISKQPPPTTDRRDCLSAMAAAGEDVSSSANRGYAFATCGGGLALAAAWKSTPLTGEGFVSGLRALGKGFTSVSTFSNDFSQRRDGVAAARPLAFQPDCDCFAYTGPAEAVGR